jgi:hypothetical protein
MEPQDLAVTAFQFRTITIVMMVRGELMPFDVGVGDSARVVGVRFVHMRRSKRR